MQPAHNYDKPEGPAEPSYAADLTCPICHQVRPQRVLRARQSLALEVRAHPFLRAFCWSEGHPRTEDSPLYYGLCLCPHCRFPGIESDFRLAPEEAHVHARCLRRMFLDEQAGIEGPVAALLGQQASPIPQPERAIRLTLACMRAEMLVGPDRWRCRELGRLYLHLFWLYLDESHFSWEGLRPLQPPEYQETGPHRERLDRLFAEFEKYRSFWPEIPLSEEAAQREVLRLHQQAYELRSSVPEAEEAVREERQLGQIYGLAGRLDQAREMYGRARQTCTRRREETLRTLQAAWDGATLTLAERRTLTATIRTLNCLFKEITEERQSLFGWSSGPTAKSAVKSAPGRPPAPPKRRFGLFS